MKYLDSLPSNFQPILEVDGTPPMHLSISHPGEGPELYAMISGSNYGHLAQFQPWVRDITTPTAAINYNYQITDQIREGRYLQYRIRQGEPGSPAPKVGASTLYDINHDEHEAKVGWWLVKDAEGGGYASRATERLLTCSKEVLNLTRVQAHIALGNERSERLAERLGFDRRGIPFPAILTEQDGLKNALMIQRWFKDL